MITVQAATQQESDIEPHQTATVIDRSGRLVTITGSQWRLNDPTNVIILDWLTVPLRVPALLDTFKAYIIHLIKSVSPSSVDNAFNGIRLVCINTSLSLIEGTRSEIPYKAFSEALGALGTHQRWRLHYFRRWYEWAADQGFEQFSPEVAFQLKQVTIGGNAKGEAVLSADPEDGPLVDIEVVALLNHLRAAQHTSILSLTEQVALWLCIGLGCNPAQLALLRAEDLERLPSPDGAAVFYQLRVPRIKKGHVQWREDFKVRKLTREIGELLEQLIVQNRAAQRIAGISSADYAEPLLARRQPRESQVNSPLREYALHLNSPEFSNLVTDAANTLNVISPRTGKRLKVTPRRLRYTFATRLVLLGKSQRVVAEALDHTDLQNVQVYFDIKSDIVEKLDASMAMALGPLSQAFLGQIVPSEPYSSGRRRESRIYQPNEETLTLDPIGTCGLHSFCSLTAPIACYTCVKFQPWVDAPHDKVLQDLLQRRTARALDGLDPRMVKIYDPTILAVADVISRIAQMRESDQAPLEQCRQSTSISGENP